MFATLLWNLDTCINLVHVIICHVKNDDNNNIIVTNT